LRFTQLKENLSVFQKNKVRYLNQSELFVMIKTAYVTTKQIMGQHF